MRFHVPDVPHPASGISMASAYQRKNRLFCEMMESLGHTVFRYGSRESNVPVVTADRQALWFSEDANWSLKWDAGWQPFKQINRAVLTAMEDRMQPRDIICLVNGWCQKSIADNFPDNQSVEYGVGYKGVFSKYVVFESAAWMHYIYGLQKVGSIARNYDAVIPNFFNVSEFPFSEKQDDYLLFVGRQTVDKGILVAIDLARELKTKLVICGPPAEIEIPKSHHTIYAGVVSYDQRNELMSQARATVVQTQYVAPFENTHVESMLCGTPVLVTDFGVFRETVQNGVNGFRCRTFQELVWAAKECANLNRQAIRAAAQERFSKDVVRHQYEAYFEQLLGLYEGGWSNAPYVPRNKP